jgi:hypothetical protein
MASLVLPTTLPFLALELHEEHQAERSGFFKAPQYAQSPASNAIRESFARPL